MEQAFRDEMTKGYALDGAGVVLGSPMVDGEVAADVRIHLALSVMNRHGLVAGATGTGKTKTLQLLAGQSSEAGVPCFVADVKGDLTGLATPGDATNPKVVERCQSLGWPFAPAAHPVEFFSLSGKLGAQIRATVHSFGPLLLGRVLGLNDTQTSILSLIFKYCDDNQLPLLDLADLTTTLKYLGSDQGKPALKDIGGMSPSSAGVLLRSIVTMEQQGADAFFGEPEFDVNDLLRTTPDGKGVVSVLELSDVMDKPALFSTFMLWLLAQLYHSLPEVGDVEKPKLAFFFDEAHLLFDNASPVLLQQVEQTARLIRSKGVGIYLVTQAPTDVPSSVLAQLGNRVQHALRAFTPEDADALKKTARTFPVSTDYDVEKLLTSLGIGEAAVTVLSERGVPTPLAATRLIPPDSLMAALDPAALQAMIAASPFHPKYGTAVDRQSAHEIITARIATAAAGAAAGAAGAGGAASPGAPAGGGSRQPARPGQRGQGRGGRARGTGQPTVRQQQQAAASKRREVETIIREGEKFATSRTGQNVMRTVFGTLFGKK